MDSYIKNWLLLPAKPIRINACIWLADLYIVRTEEYSHYLDSAIFYKAVYQPWYSLDKNDKELFSCLFCASAVCCTNCLQSNSSLLW